MRLPGLGEDLTEDSDDLVELLLAATSGGEIWTTGSPRSSARQIRPFSNSCPREEAAQQRLGLLVGERLARLLVLHELERPEVAGAAQVADDVELEQRRELRRGRPSSCSRDVLDDLARAP